MSASFSVLESAEARRRLSRLVESLEKQRQEQLFERNKSLILAGVGGGGLLLIALMAGLPLLAIPLALVGLIYVIRSNSVSHKRYRRLFKMTVVPLLLQEMAPGTHYKPQYGIAQTDFLDSGLVDSPLGHYDVEDLLEGKIGSTRFQISDLRARPGSDESSGRSGSMIYSSGSLTGAGLASGGFSRLLIGLAILGIGKVAQRGMAGVGRGSFDGVYMIADFHKQFFGKTVVLPDVAEKSAGHVVGQGVQRRNSRFGQLMVMEDPEFEAEFVVYGTDPVESRYLLTTSMMQRILRLKRRTGSEVSVVFANNRLHLAMGHFGDLFEVDLGTSLQDGTVVERIHGQLHDCLGLVDELNLNTRIWTRPPESA